MEPTLITSLFLGISILVILSIVMDLHFIRDAVHILHDIAITIVEYIGDYNKRRYIERVKTSRILIEKEGFIAQYNHLVQQLIQDLKLPVTLESFTTIITLGFIICVLIVALFMKSIPLAVVIGIAVLVAILTWAVVQSKKIKGERLENIMDAEDLICPLAREGVLVAIKKVMESDDYISPNIRPYFEQFIDNLEYNGYSFRQAMVLLNKQLGPKFDNFAKKAIIFEYNERPGMADVFLDIVDENAILREINGKKEAIFRKMNREFFIKTVLILLFFLYAISVPEFKQFIFNTDMGKFLNTSLITAICISFARCQALQGDLGGGE